MASDWDCTVASVYIAIWCGPKVYMITTVECVGSKGVGSKWQGLVKRLQIKSNLVGGALFVGGFAW